MFLSLLIILVGAEYYEIPVFVCGYLGVAGYGFPHVLNHVIVAFMFGLLVWFTDMKATKINVLALLMGPLLTAPLLLFVHGTLILYLAKAIGLSILFIVAINSPGVGGSKSKMP